MVFFHIELFVETQVSASARVSLLDDIGFSESLPFGKDAVNKSGRAIVWHNEIVLK